MCAQILFWFRGSWIKPRRLQKITQEFYLERKNQKKKCDNLFIVFYTPETELLKFMVMHCIKLHARGRAVLNLLALSQVDVE
jgi:hypothetical protein